MSIVPLPLMSHDLQCETSPQVRIVQRTDSGGRWIHSVLLWGRPVRKRDGVRLTQPPGWFEVRFFDSGPEARTLMNLLTTGAVSPEDAQSWSAVAGASGEIVEDVASLHRRLRR